MHPKMVHYASVITALMNARLSSSTIPILHSFWQASKSLNSSVSYNRYIQDSWDLLKCMLEESPTTGHPAAIFAQGYTPYTEEPESNAAIEFRKKIVVGGRKWLQVQFWKWLVNEVQKKPREAELGGAPTSHDWVKAYLRIKFFKYDRWDIPGTTDLYPIPGFDFKAGYPVWAHIWYLIRSGQGKEAIEWWDKYIVPTRLDPEFGSFLRAWIDSSNRGASLSGPYRDQIVKEYQSKLRSTSGVGGIVPVGGRGGSDIFKAALYKVMGRCDMKKAVAGGIIEATEDWLWVQLSYCLEISQGALIGSETYGLQDFSETVRKYGNQQFGEGRYFLVLLLAGEFELAVAWLAMQSGGLIEAVHFGIALKWYGCLKVPHVPGRLGASNLLVEGREGKGEIYYGRLIWSYVRGFWRSNPTIALAYVTCIVFGDGADNEAPGGYTELSWYRIREIVLGTKEFDLLLGELKRDGSITKGEVAKIATLVHLDTDASIEEKIISPAAAEADRNGNFKDSVRLYNLAGEYETVVKILSQRLGEALGLRKYSGEGGDENVLEKEPRENIIQLAEDVVSFYNQYQHIYSKIPPASLKTITTILGLLKFMELYQGQHFEQALLLLDTFNLIPTSDTDIPLIRSMAEDFKLLDESIRRNFGDILVAAMTATFRLWEATRGARFSDSGRISKLEELQKRGRAIMVYAGQLRYRFSAEVYSVLNRLDVYMS